MKTTLQPNQCVNIEPPWTSDRLPVYAHPNAQCTPDTWDQRIPNEPLFKRNFLIDRPPIIPQNRPNNTSLCTPACLINQPWLLMNHDTEEQSMLYWSKHTISSKSQGVNSTDNSPQSLKKMIAKYPDRPWLTSIPKNIVQDSKLSERDYYNPQDYINNNVSTALTRMNSAADKTLLKELTPDQRLDGIRMWNQSTSPRMTEPIDFNYRKYITTCDMKYGRTYGQSLK
jgi:hypothetical protein